MNQPRRNILLILTDQHRFDIVGANGSRFCRSPAIDSLAAAGVNFTQAYSCCGVCSPARASIYTGQLPHRHGITRNVSEQAAIPTSIPTLAERLNAHGYRSYFAGKWHAGARQPTDCGFEGMDVPGYGDVRQSPLYRQYLADHGLELPTIEPIGVGWAQNVTLAGKLSGPVEASVPCFLAEYTLDLMERHRRERPEAPFFLALNFWGPHAPYLPSEPYASMVDPDDLEPWGNFDDDLTDKPPIYRRYRDAFIGEGQPPRSWDECARWAALYYGFAMQIDDQIGRVLKRLREYGWADDTAVLFSTDHGDLCGAHGGMHDKNAIMCQEVYHIPLVASVPWLREAHGSICDAPITNLNLPATVLDLAGVSVPESFDAPSLRPLLEDPANQDVPDYAASEFFGNHFAYETRMIVQDQHKYVFHPGSLDELYDLKTDPWELHNRIDDPALKPMLDQLRLRLLHWMREHDDDLCIVSGLFEARQPWTPDTAAPYGPGAMQALRNRPPKLK